MGLLCAIELFRQYIKHQTLSDGKIKNICRKIRIGIIQHLSSILDFINQEYYILKSGNKNLCIYILFQYSY